MAGRDDDVLATDAGSVETVDVPVSLRGVGALAEGQLVDHYMIGERIGVGGIGEVYRATDQTLQRTVAIKVMRPSAHKDRSLAEAQALAKLSHPNVVVVHEAGLVDGRVFIAMEYVEGATLRTWLTPQRTWREIVAMYLAAGRGLVALHHAGLVHRDFKPDNVLVGTDGRPRVADLGLAVHVADSTNVQGGTPRYMAPEQRAGVVDARSDQYAFAVALSEALDGRSSPSWIRAPLERAMRGAPDARWPSLGALLVELERDPIAARRRLGLAIGGAVVLGLAIAGGIHLRGRDAAAACEVAANRIERVWTPFDAIAMSARFVGAGRAHGATTASLARADLDRYVDRWRDDRRDVCLATARHEQTAATAELRVRCFDRLADELRALANVFEQDVDVALVDRAIHAIDQLTPPDRCTTSAALADVPLPSPEQAARVAELRAASDANVAMYRAGRFQQGVVDARDLVAQARALGYAPLLADTLIELARYEAALHDDGAAERDDTDAITAAGQAHDDAVANVAWRGLVDMAIAHQKLDSAGERLVFARAASARSGGDPATEAGLDLAEANLFYARGDYDHALAHVDHALEHASSRDDDRADALNLRARVLEKLHRDPEALAAMREAEQIWERELGPDHPNIATALSTIAAGENAMLKFDDAERDLDRALALTESIYGPSSYNTALVLDARSFTRIGRRDLAEAKTDGERSLAIKIGHDGPDAVTTAATMSTLAKIAEQQNDLSHALQLREQILAIHIGALGEDHPDVVHDLFNLGTTAQSAHDTATARVYFERGERLAMKIHDDTQIADGAISLASLYSTIGRHADALAQMRIALAGHEALDKVHPTPFSAMNIATDHKISGGVELEAGNLAGAEAELRKTVALMEAIVGGKESDLVDSLGILGAVLLEENKFHDVIAVARRGIAVCESTTEMCLYRGGLYFELAQGLWEDGDHAGSLAAARTARGVYASMPQEGDVKAQSDELVAWLAGRR
ncbi:MAG TPA: serine/threonine-protein kinase [Kofleriaceae bacterium]|jgi:tetratricopeptide (TPR) repeat protein/predicted Ser/Thr protein kinase